MQSVKSQAMTQRVPLWLISLAARGNAQNALIPSLYRTERKAGCHSQATSKGQAKLVYQPQSLPPLCRALMICFIELSSSPKLCRELGCTLKSNPREVLKLLNKAVFQLVDVFICLALQLLLTTQQSLCSTLYWDKLQWISSSLLWRKLITRHESKTRDTFFLQGREKPTLPSQASFGNVEHRTRSCAP